MARLQLDGIDCEDYCIGSTKNVSPFEAGLFLQLIQRAAAA